MAEIPDCGSDGKPGTPCTKSLFFVQTVGDEDPILGSHSVDPSGNSQGTSHSHRSSMCSSLVIRCYASLSPRIRRKTYAYMLHFESAPNIDRKANPGSHDSDDSRISARALKMSSL